MTEFEPLLKTYARKNQLLGKQSIMFDYSIYEKQEIFEIMEMLEADLLALYKEIVDHVSQITCDPNKRELR